MLLMTSFNFGKNNAKLPGSTTLEEIRLVMWSRLRDPLPSYSIGFPVATILRKISLKSISIWQLVHNCFFRYSYIPIIGPIFVDDVPNQRGGINFLKCMFPLQFQRQADLKRQIFHVHGFLVPTASPFPFQIRLPTSAH